MGEEKRSNYCHLNYDPIFAEGADFVIYSDSNIKKSSFSYLGDSYAHPNYTFGSNRVKDFLAGSYNFSTADIEVYQLIWYYLFQF